MHDRSALGPADVGDARLAVLVAAALGVDDVELLSSRAEVVAYDIEALIEILRERAAAARFVLDLVAATERRERS